VSVERRSTEDGRKSRERIRRSAEGRSSDKWPRGYLGAPYGGTWDETRSRRRSSDEDRWSRGRSVSLEKRVQQRRLVIQGDTTREELSGPRRAPPPSSLPLVSRRAPPVPGTRAYYNRRSAIDREEIWPRGQSPPPVRRTARNPFEMEEWSKALLTSMRRDRSRESWRGHSKSRSRSRSSPDSLGRRKAKRRRSVSPPVMSRGERVARPKQRGMVHSPGWRPRSESSSPSWSASPVPPPPRAKKGRIARPSSKSRSWSASPVPPPSPPMGRITRPSSKSRSRSASPVAPSPPSMRRITRSSSRCRSRSRSTPLWARMRKKPLLWVRNHSEPLVIGRSISRARSPEEPPRRKRAPRPQTSVLRQLLGKAICKNTDMDEKQIESAERMLREFGQKEKKAKLIYSAYDVAVGSSSLIPEDRDLEEGARYKCPKCKRGFFTSDAVDLHLETDHA